MERTRKAENGDEVGKAERREMKRIRKAENGDGEARKGER